MKSIFLAISVVFLLFSCKKGEVVQPEVESNGYSGHYAYIKGMVTDSLTGAPITGYNLRVNGPNEDSDTLIDGNYSLYVYWFFGHYSYPKPLEVEILVMDSTYTIIDEMTFDGNLLVEDDTVVVNFQVSL